MSTALTTTARKPEALALAVSTFKGGAGKTMLTINLGGEFGHQGHKVLLIDCDRQQSLYRWFKVSQNRGLLSANDNIDAIAVAPEEDLNERIKAAPAADIHIYDVGGHAHERAIEIFERVHAVVIPIILEATSASQAANISMILKQLAVRHGKPVTPHAAIWNNLDLIALKNNRAIPEVTKILKAAEMQVFSTKIRKSNHYSDVSAGFGTLYTKLNEINSNSKTVPSAKRRASESIIDAIDQIRSLNNEFIELVGQGA